ncbi:MAG: DUF2141 domain-containing protein [Curvibacter sp.]|jgi:uncharacterized protein (DUF2141 family)
MKPRSLRTPSQARSRGLLLVLGVAVFLATPKSVLAANSEQPETEKAHIAQWQAEKNDPSTPKASLRIRVHGLSPGVGSVRVGLYDAKIKFPAEGRHLEDRVQTVATSDNQTIVFADLPLGEYALALIYDVNNNAKLDYHMGIFPAEPLAFSGGARAGMFGPPRFEDAKFTLKADATLDVQFR